MGILFQLLSFLEINSTVVLSIDLTYLSEDDRVVVIFLIVMINKLFSLGNIFYSQNRFYYCYISGCPKRFVFTNNKYSSGEIHLLYNGSNFD